MSENAAMLILMGMYMAFILGLVVAALWAAYHD